MRRFELIVGGLALVVLSLSFTLYVVNHARRGPAESGVVVEAPPGVDPRLAPLLKFSPAKQKRKPNKE